MRSFEMRWNMSTHSVDLRSRKTHKLWPPGLALSVPKEKLGAAPTWQRRWSSSPLKTFVFSNKITYLKESQKEPTTNTSGNTLKNFIVFGPKGLVTPPNSNPKRAAVEGTWWTGPGVTVGPCEASAYPYTLFGPTYLCDSKWKSEALCSFGKNSNTKRTILEPKLR